MQPNERRGHVRAAIRCVGGTKCPQAGGNAMDTKLVGCALHLLDGSNRCSSGEQKGARTKGGGAPRELETQTRKRGARGGPLLNEVKDPGDDHLEPSTDMRLWPLRGPTWAMANAEYWPGPKSSALSSPVGQREVLHGGSAEPPGKRSPDRSRRDLSPLHGPLTNPSAQVELGPIPARKEAL